ncbi:lamin tail domain-containing protein [Herpetosiphon giganteus]|uniref:lamin tail domain-containing protein n=1 Tax=Herpetosiphon giganteus TaxID=2029754 RepID=UPI001958659C|nr:lamin tail domain-containing protein [Herpetosiphon giganteus]MBM7845332.1 hypothetical protein [Herpetosiphon giganteus]
MQLRSLRSLLTVDRARIGSLLSVFLVGLMAWMLPQAGARPTFAVSNGVVISQVYGGGGNSGATYTHDFVELFNRGSAAVSLNGWSIQYTSANSSGLFSGNIAILPNFSLQPGQYFLARLASGGAVGAALPTADVSANNINMSGTAGKVIVANTTTGLACNGGSTACTSEQQSQIVDLVGFGTTANYFEGSSPAPAPSNTTSVIRTNPCVDADNNATEFTAVAPNPRNSASPTLSCSAATNTPTNTATNTPTNTATNTPTNTATNTPTNTATNTPTNTATATETPAPTSTPVLGGDNNILWDYLYHSATSANPQTELVPGESYSFLHSATGTINETTAVTISALTDALDVQNASLRYWDGTTSTTIPMTRSKSLTASFRNQASHSYDLWLASIPAQAVGTTVFYRVIVQDGGSTAYMKQTNGQYVNPLGQHVRGFNDDPDDYSYTVVASNPTAIPTSTATETPTNTATVAPTATDEPTATATETPTNTATVAPTATNTATVAPTATNTVTPSPTATDEPTTTATVAPTATDEPTATATIAPTATDEPTTTATVAPTATDEPTTTATVAPTATDEPTTTATVAPTATDEPTTTATVAPTATDEPTATATQTTTPTITVTLTVTPGEPTATATQTATPTITVTVTVTPGSPTPTNTPTSTATQTPTHTPTATLVPTATNTAIPTQYKVYLPWTGK